MPLDLVRRCLYHSGILGAHHRLRNRATLTVVMYHRVLSPQDARWASCDPDYTISDHLFARTVRFLKRHYNLVDVDRVLLARRGIAALPPRALLITFDDGWSDNVDYALPILRREQAPALLFTVADAVGRHRPFFQEEIVGAWRGGRLPPEVVTRLETAAGLIEPGTPGLSAVRRLIAALESLPAADRDAILEPLGDSLQDGLRHMVSAEDLGQLRDGAVAIGLHGKTHTPMTRAEDLDAELDGARRVVAGHLGAEPSRLSTLSFPHGRWTPEIVERARTLGFELMFTSVPGLNGLAAGCPDLLARVGVETEVAQDGQGRFRPDRLALRLFRRPVERLG